MRAEHCARLAEQATDDYHRKNFQQLAAMWTEMAQKAESREAAVEDAREENDFDDPKAIEDALETIRNA